VVCLTVDSNGWLKRNATSISAGTPRRFVDLCRINLLLSVRVVARAVKTHVSICLAGLRAFGLAVALCRRAEALARHCSDHRGLSSGRFLHFILLWASACKFAIWRRTRIHFAWRCVDAVRVAGAWGGTACLGSARDTCGIVRGLDTRRAGFRVPRAAPKHTCSSPSKPSALMSVPCSRIACTSAAGALAARGQARGKNRRRVESAHPQNESAGSWAVVAHKRNREQLQLGLSRPARAA